MEPLSSNQLGERRCDKRCGFSTMAQTYEQKSKSSLALLSIVLLCACGLRADLVWME